MEVSFSQEIKSLRLGAGDTFHGEGILAITKALLQSGVSYVGGYQGAPVSHLLDVLDHLAPAAKAPGENAAAIAAARTATLADDAGIALDAALVRHGAPARPVKEQPLRFIRKMPALQPDD